MKALLFDLHSAVNLGHPNDKKHPQLTYIMRTSGLPGKLAGVCDSEGLRIGACGFVSASGNMKKR